MIDSIRREKQKMPALARKLVGDPNWDFEVIYGMRRRFACEYLNVPLRIVVREISDTLAAVEMDIENRLREDISAMERAMSYARQLKDGLFPTQGDLAKALGLTQGRISQWVKAAQIMEEPAIEKLFPDVSMVPVKAAQALAAQLEDKQARALIIKAATNLHARDGHLKIRANAIIARLIKAPERSSESEEGGTTFRVVDRELNVGSSGRMKLKRNGKGKVTLVFPDGVNKENTDVILAAVKEGIELLH
jgi:ParB family chromosome partitioning protein